MQDRCGGGGGGAGAQQVSFSCVSGACTEEMHPEQTPPFQAELL